MSEIQNSSFDDLKQLSETDLKQIEENNDLKSVEELKNVISNLNTDVTRSALVLDDRGEADYSHSKMSEIYKDFINDTNEIIKDGIIDSIELTRLESINKVINASNSALLGEGSVEFNEIADEDIDNIKSIKQLVYSREILDRIGDGNDVSSPIHDLKIILGLIENVGTSNINDNDLNDINKLIIDIFDEGIDKSDIIRLQKLQVMLLVTYNFEQNQKYENFSLDDEKVEGKNKEEIKDTKDLLNLLAELDNEYGDELNEIAPTIGNFLDSIAIEVKNGLIEGDWNNLGSSLRLVLKQFGDFKKSFDKIDFSDPIGSKNAIIEFSNKINGFDKVLLGGNTLNLIRHMLPTCLGLFFTGIKEVKNYYLKSTGPETNHGVFIQEMHIYRDEIKNGNYTFDWLKDIASIGADGIDNKIINTLSLVNGGSDAILDFSGSLLNTLFLPEKTLGRLTKGFSDICSGGINIDFNDLIPDNISQELISKVIYMLSYIVMYMTASSIVPGLIGANKFINKMLNEISNIIGKPIKPLQSIIDKGINKMSQTDEFKKLNLIVKKGSKVNKIEEKFINNIKGHGQGKLDGDGLLNHLDKISGKVSRYTNNGSNNLENTVNRTINKAI